MVTYQIYSVSDKAKIDAEVTEVREVSGSRGVRYQVVGVTPAGKQVSTFCNQQTADDLRSQLGVSVPETTELAAEEETEVVTEEVETTEEEILDRIVEIQEEAEAVDIEVDEGEAPVISDETGELIESEAFAAEEEPVNVEEDPGETEVIADEDGTVMAAEGEAEVIEQEEQEYDSIPDAGTEESPEAPAEDTAVEAVTAVEDTAEGLVPLGEQIPQGYGPVLGQQTLEMNFGPMHAEMEELVEVEEDEGTPSGDEYAMMEKLVKLEEKLENTEDADKRKKIEKQITTLLGQIDDIVAEDADSLRAYDRGEVMYYDDDDDEGYELWEDFGAEDGGSGSKLLIPGLVLGGLALVAALKPDLVKNMFDSFKKE